MAAPARRPSAWRRRRSPSARARAPARAALAPARSCAPAAPGQRQRRPRGERRASRPRDRSRAAGCATAAAGTGRACRSAASPGSVAAICAAITPALGSRRRASAPARRPARRVVGRGRPAPSNATAAAAQPPRPWRGARSADSASRASHGSARRQPAQSSASARARARGTEMHAGGATMRAARPARAGSSRRLATPAPPRRARRCRARWIAVPAISGTRRPSGGSTADYLESCAFSVDALWTFAPIVLLLAGCLGVYVARCAGLAPRRRAAASAAAAARARRRWRCRRADLPVDVLGRAARSMHMVQHLLLADIAPILLMLGLTRRSCGRSRAASPRRARRRPVRVPSSPSSPTSA